MGSNLEILKKWQNSLSCYPKLTITEAKQLYRKSLESSVENNYLNDLIMGTLYIVSNYIRNNGLIYLNSSSYDMNDIISTCNEIWIDKISSGKLLKIKSFGEMFDSEFFNKLCDGLGVKKCCIGNSIINTNLFVELLIDYIKLKEKDCEFNYIKLIEYMKNNAKYEKIISRMYYYSDDIDYYKIRKICEIFDGIIKSFGVSELDIKMTKTTIDKLKYILISNGLEQSKVDINRIVTIDTTESILNAYSKKQIIEIVLNSSLNDSQKEILIKRYGLLDDESHTIEDIANQQGLSKQRIRDKEAKALRLLRHPRYTKRIKEWM